MTCEEAKNLIAAHFDRELDEARDREVERHISECTECRQAAADHLRLSQAIRTGYAYEPTPSALREKIDRATGGGSLRRSWLMGFGPGLAVGAFLMFFVVHFWPKATLPTEELVAMHVRSMAGQLVAVESSDRHTVKPWFQGKLDFSPDVVDLAPRGFPLIGGRLERIDGRPAAALVYRRKAHIINVFVTGGEPKAGGEGDQQGFHVRHFSLHGLDYWVVSDVRVEDIVEFEALFQAALK